MDITNNQKICSVLSRVQKTEQNKWETYKNKIATRSAYTQRKGPEEYLKHKTTFKYLLHLQH